MTKELVEMAKLRLIEARVEGQLLDNRLASALALSAEIAGRSETLRDRWDQASPAQHRFGSLTGEISTKTVSEIMDFLIRWDRMDLEDGRGDRPYTLTLCSQGGDVVPGFQLYSFLHGLGLRRPLTIIATGLCASMATLVHQAASPGCRIIEPGCTYLLHEVSGGVGGRFDSIKDTTDWMHKLNDQMREIYASRSGVLTAEEIKEKTARRETFLTPEEALAWGLVDEIRFP